MMQAAKPWHGYDLGSRAEILLGQATRWRLLRQPEMHPVFVVIADVLIHEAFQTVFVDDDHTVKQVAAAVANPALSNAVLPRTTETGPLVLDAKHLLLCFL